jgi:hypothetical protein
LFWFECSIGGPKSFRINSFWLCCFQCASEEAKLLARARVTTGGAEGEAEVTDGWLLFGITIGVDVACEEAVVVFALALDALLLLFFASVFRGSNKAPEDEVVNAEGETRPALPSVRLRTRPPARGAEGREAVAV